MPRVLRGKCVDRAMYSVGLYGIPKGAEIEQCLFNTYDYGLRTGVGGQQVWGKKGKNQKQGTRAHEGTIFV